MTIETEAHNRAVPCPSRARTVRGFGALHLQTACLTLLGALLCIAALCAGPASAAPALTWTVQREIDTHPLRAISCPSAALCVAVDASGNMLYSSNPTASSPNWSAPAQIDSGHALTAVSCVSFTCAAVDGSGEVLLSTSPGSGAGSWHSITVDGGAPLNDISCASGTLCVAVDSAGNTIAVDPTNFGAGAVEANIDGTNQLHGISCPGPDLCVAVDDAGNVLVSANPAAQSPSWRPRAIDPGLDLGPISCVPGGLCLALDRAGNAFASNNPTELTPTWNSTEIDPTAPPTGVSCTSAGLCAVVDAGGRALASDDMTGAPPTWSGISADLFGVAIEGVSCLPEGQCLAVDSSGRVLSALVPTPSLTLAPTGGLTQSAATLAGTVDPNDALLGECVFEYGTSTYYGLSVSCESLPLPSSAPEAVSAQLSGLEPGTTYHYRLRASNGAGAGLSTDGVFMTVAKPTVSVIKPHPSISGVPAVGLRLRCNSGIPSGTEATLSYAWVRDATKLSGATGSSYLVKPGDAKHHLQCKVTATNVAGSASASSAFVAIPAQGIVAAAGETLVGKVTTIGSRVSVPLTCSPQSVGSCQIGLRMTVVETLRGSKVLALAARRSAHKPVRTRQVTLTVAASSVQLTPGQHSTISLVLNGTGSRLLSREHKLPVQLAVSGTVIGSIKASLASLRLSLTGASHSSSRRAISSRH